MSEKITKGIAAPREGPDFLIPEMTRYCSNAKSTKLIARAKKSTSIFSIERRRPHIPYGPTTRDAMTVIADPAITAYCAQFLFSSDIRVADSELPPQCSLLAASDVDDGMLVFPELSIIL